MADDHAQWVGNTDRARLRASAAVFTLGDRLKRASVRAGLVWVGYGIRAEEHNYDDYGQVDVRGKVVMMLRKEPGVANPKSPFDGVQNTRHAFFETKTVEAMKQGAVGVVLVNDPASVRAGTREIDKRRAGETKRLAALNRQIEKLPAEAKNIRERLLARKLRSEKMLLAIQSETVAAARGVLDIGEAGLSTIAPAGKSVPVMSISRPLADRILRERSSMDEENGLEGIEAAIDSGFQPRSF